MIDLNEYTVDGIEQICLPYKDRVVIQRLESLIFKLAIEIKMMQHKLNDGQTT